MLKNIIITLIAVAFPTLACAGEPIWRAQRQSVYEPSGNNSQQLTLSYNAAITYNAEGQPVETVMVFADGERQRRTTTYDRPGGQVVLEVTEIFSNGRWIPMSRKTRTYDERTGIITSNIETNYVDGQERQGNCYRRTITRDEAGNVTEVVISVPYNGSYDATRRMTVTADSIVVSELTYDGFSFSWVDAEIYTNIVWERTDGQIVSVDDLFTGANRLQSARFENYNGSKPYFDYQIAATYGEGNDFDCTMTGLYQGYENSEVKRSYTEHLSGANGCKTYCMLTSYDVVGSEEPAEFYREVIEIDAWGIETLYRETSWLEGEADETVEVERTTEVTYDQTYGYPLKAVAVEDGTTLTRVDYSNYIDCTGNSSLRTIQGTGRSENPLFDMGGRRVTPGAKGWKLSRHSKEFIK